MVITDNTTQNMRKLVDYIAPSRRSLVGYDSVPRGSVEEVGRGQVKPIHEGRGALATAKNSFTCVAFRDEELGRLTLWYSYETPIAVFASDLKAKVLSTYTYSSTTNRHQSAVRSGLLGEAAFSLHIDGHVAAGGSYIDVLNAKAEKLSDEILRIKRARAKKNYVYTLRAALRDYQDAARLLDPQYVPKLPVLKDDEQLLAKVTAWRLHNSEINQLMDEAYKLV